MPKPTVADAKAENDALRDDVAGRRLHIKAVCQSVRGRYRLRRVLPRLADTAEQDYFTLRELITMQKQLEGTQKYINEQCRWCPYRWATHASNTHALPAEYKCLK